MFSKLPRSGISSLVFISHWSCCSSWTVDSSSSGILGCGVLAWKGNLFASSNWFWKFWAKRRPAISLIWLMFTWSNTQSIHSAVWSWGWVSCSFQSSVWFQPSLFPKLPDFPNYRWLSYAVLQVLCRQSVKGRRWQRKWLCCFGKGQCW